MGIEQHLHIDKPDLALLTSVLGPPVAWLLQFQARYSLVDWACVHHKVIVLHLTSLVFLLASVGAGLLGWTRWKQSGGKNNPDLTSAGRGRSQFLALLGVSSSSIFSLVIVAQAIPAFIIDPCRH